MNHQAIEALKQFKEMHLAMEAKQEADKVSQSHSVQSTEVNPSRVPKKINYPAHIKPLKERIMSALANGCRTPDSVATYCGENIKLVTLQLGRWVSRGMIGRHTNVVSGITRYYPHDIAKEKGFLTKPQPINRKKKFVMPKSLKKADEALAAKQLDLFKDIPAPIRAKEEQYILFLEKRVAEWQAESRKQAHEIEDLKAKLVEVRKTRDVTSEVTEVMEEVTKLRATVAYLESKLFGSK